MKKVVMSVVAALAIAAPAYAADMPVKAVKAAPAPATPAWDIAVGGAVMSDYNFRGISQSNHGVSGGAYFEPQFNTPIGQFYTGIAAWAVNWPGTANYGFTDPNAEVDLYGGWRNSWGPVSLDLGLIYYWYPQEEFNGFTSKSDFYELYGKLGYAITSDLSVGLNVFWTPNLLHYSTTICTATAGANCSSPDATYASVTAKWVTPLNINGIGAFISGELGHWWIDDSGFIAAGATADPSYTYWNAGVAFTYKALTLDLRYHDTNQSKQDCANFLLVGLGNGSNNWCDARFVASLKFDTTLSAIK